MDLKIALSAISSKLITFGLSLYAVVLLNMKLNPNDVAQSAEAVNRANLQQSTWLG